MALLLKIFQLSIMGSITAGVILIVKEIFNNQLGAKAHYYIWIFLLLRLLVPCLPDSPVSLFNVTPMVQQEINLEANNAISLSKLNRNTTGNKQRIKNKSSINNPTIPQIENLTTNNTNNLLQIGFVIWLIGGLLLGAIIIKRNFNFWLKIKELNPLDNPKLNQMLTNCRETMNINSNVKILKTNLIESPTLYGLIKPKILLPSAMVNQINQQQLKHILLHELAHIKRKDILVNCVTIILQIIHWFNPFLWYAFYRLKQDQEVATDSQALSCLPQDKSTNYGQTIIDLLEVFPSQTRIKGLIGFLEHKSQIKRRLQMINSFKQKSKQVSVLVLVLFVLLGAISLTNAQEVTINQQQSAKNIGLRIKTEGVHSTQDVKSLINSQTIIEYYQQNSNSAIQTAKIRLPKGKPIFLTALAKGISLTITYKEKLVVSIKHKDGLSTSYQLPYPQNGLVSMTSNKLEQKKEQDNKKFIANEKIPQGTKFLKVFYPQNSDSTPYLRFKAVKNGTTVNPLPYLK